MDGKAEEADVILPAGPHKLFVAYFDKGNIEDADSEDIQYLVSCDPIIGWVVVEENPADHMPQPVTPKAVLKSGVDHRLIGDDPEALLRDATALAQSMWRRTHASDVSGF